MDNSNCNHNEGQIKSNLEKYEKYINELDEKLCDYDKVIDQRDENNRKMSAALLKLDSMKTKQTDTINELVCKHDEVSHVYNTDRVQLAHLIEENDCLRNGNEELCITLDEKETLLEESDHLHSTLLKDAQDLQHQFQEAMDLKNACQDRNQLAETELRVTNQNLICKQNEIAKKLIFLTELEKNYNNELSRSACLRTSINEINIKYDKTVICLKSEITEYQSKLNDIYPKLATNKRKLREKHEEIETQNCRLVELNERVQILKEDYATEKNKAEKILDQLKAEDKSLASNLESINSEICDTQVESAKLKCQLEGLEGTNKHLESIKKQLEEEIRKIKKANELTMTMSKTKHEEHEQKVKAFERKSELKDHENNELEQSINKHNEQIKKLKKQLFDMKFKSSDTWTSVAITSSKSDTCIDDILCDGKEKSVATCTNSCKIFETNNGE